MLKQPLLSGFERPERQNNTHPYLDPLTADLPQAERFEKILEALRAATQPHTASEIAGKAILHNHGQITSQDLMVLRNEGKVKQIGDKYEIGLEVVDGQD